MGVRQKEILGFLLVLLAFFCPETQQVSCYLEKHEKKRVSNRVFFLDLHSRFQDLCGRRC